MAFKIIEDQPIVNQDDVPKHWLKKTREECFSQANFLTQASSSVIVSTSQQTRQKSKLTEVQKRSKAMILAEELVNVMVNCGQNQFDERCTVIERLIGEWRAGRDLPASSSSTDQHCGENQNANDQPSSDALQELNCIGEELIEPVIFDGVEGESGDQEEVQCIGGMPMTLEDIKIEPAESGEAITSNDFNVGPDQDTINTFFTTVSDCAANDSPLGNLKFKSVIKKRGRPKGAGFTSGHYAKKQKK
ncbi:hypothetical protein ElyMa_003940600 [Elysia marginata]|uniref:Uncharacterized protein n=1 Tax=Elysia marginata TaxID=1093978 RepID=A0AAV4FVC5_9GAST|nr:hypothetical protein ElyMa_003940600 [Elysia marginata]